MAADLPRQPANRDRRIVDWPPHCAADQHVGSGSGLTCEARPGLATVIALVLLPLTVGRASGWPLWTWICLAAAVPAGIAFVASQYREERLGRVPLLPPSLLGLPLARLALATIALFGTCVGGFLFSLSIILQVGHGYSPLKAGLTMARARWRSLRSRFRLAA